MCPSAHGLDITNAGDLHIPDVLAAHGLHTSESSHLGVRLGLCDPASTTHVYRGKEFEHEPPVRYRRASNRLFIAACISPRLPHCSKKLRGLCPHS
jgi:hypothetical protein